MGATRGRVRITLAYTFGIKATGKREMYRDDEIPGLVLRVSPDARSRVWYFDYHNRDGRRRLLRIGDLKDFHPMAARDQALRLSRQVKEGGDPAADQADARQAARRNTAPTLRSYLDGVYVRRHLQDRKSGTATADRIRKAWAPLLDLSLSGLTAATLARHREGRLEAGVKASTLNRDRTALMHLLKCAVAEGVVEGDPADGFERLKENGGQRLRWLGQRDPDERRRFQAVLQRQPHYIRALVGLALETGLQRGEIFNLRWTDVDLQARELLCRSGTSKPRGIPLNQSAVDILRFWRDAAGKVINIDGLVFPNPKTGRPYTSIKRAWASLVTEARVEDFRFQDCRHDYASRLVMAGVPLHVVGSLLGHSTVQLTERYLSLVEDGRRAAVEMLG